MIANDLSQSVASLVAGALTVAVVMAGGLLWARRTQRLTIVDTLWGLGFVAVAVVTLFVSDRGDGRPGPATLLLVLTGLWGLRLAAYLTVRNTGKGEDPRYAELAEADGRSFAQVALRRVFLPQGIAMFLVATPVMVGMNNAGTVTWLGWLGVLVWAVGLFFEAVGDQQLARFKADPENQGKVMDRGLWRYTRHPNYFGDACVWTGIWLVAASSWAGVVTVVSPIAMTIFLTKVTGAANNEKGMHRSKPDYADYVRRTSGFVPLPPRKG